MLSSHGDVKVRSAELVVGVVEYDSVYQMLDEGQPRHGPHHFHHSVFNKLITPILSQFS